MMNDDLEELYFGNNDFPHCSAEKGEALLEFFFPGQIFFTMPPLFNN